MLTTILLLCTVPEAEVNGRSVGRPAAAAGLPDDVVGCWLLVELVSCVGVLF